MPGFNLTANCGEAGRASGEEGAAVVVCPMDFAQLPFLILAGASLLLFLLLPVGLCWARRAADKKRRAAALAAPRLIKGGDGDSKTGSKKEKGRNNKKKAKLDPPLPPPPPPPSLVIAAAAEPSKSHKAWDSKSPRSATPEDETQKSTKTPGSRMASRKSKHLANTLSDNDDDDEQPVPPGLALDLKGAAFLKYLTDDGPPLPPHRATLAVLAACVAALALAAETAALYYWVGETNACPLRDFPAVLLPPLAAGGVTVSLLAAALAACLLHFAAVVRGQSKAAAATHKRRYPAFCPLLHSQILEPPSHLCPLQNSSHARRCGAGRTGLCTRRYLSRHYARAPARLRGLGRGVVGGGCGRFLGRGVCGD
jgi:hypothetical protein